jgi:hypothetical protein
MSITDEGQLLFRQLLPQIQAEQASDVGPEPHSARMETPGPLEGEGVVSNPQAGGPYPAAGSAPEGTDTTHVTLGPPDVDRSLDLAAETGLDDLAAAVAARLDGEIVDVLSERNRQLEAECSALRRIAAEAVIAAREAASFAFMVPDGGFAFPAEVAFEDEPARSRWRRVFRR